MPELTEYRLRQLRKNARQIRQLNEAYDRYQDALRHRQHGGVALDKLGDEVAGILGRDHYEFERPAKKTSINGNGRKR